MTEDPHIYLSFHGKDEASRLRQQHDHHLPRAHTCESESLTYVSTAPKEIMILTVGRLRKKDLGPCSLTHFSFLPAGIRVKDPALQY